MNNSDLIKIGFKRIDHYKDSEIEYMVYQFKINDTTFIDFTETIFPKKEKCFDLVVNNEMTEVYFNSTEEIINFKNHFNK
jgi:hypothetical protein